MKTTFVLLAILLTTCAGTAQPATAQQSACADRSQAAREVVVGFLSAPKWKEGREKASSTGISADAVQRVSDNAVCQTLNEKNSELINETMTQDDPSSGPAYDFAYYRAEGRYFVVFLPLQPENTGEVVVGYTFFRVYDGGLSKLAGYFF